MPTAINQEFSQELYSHDDLCLAAGNCSAPFGWSGGKQKQVKIISRFMPTDFSGTYYEPFLGGGSILLNRIAVHGLSARAYIVGDYNDALINFWAVLKHSTEKLIDQLGQYEFEKNRSLSKLRYYEMRRSFNAEAARRAHKQPMGSFSECRELNIHFAAQFFFLIRSCYGNIWQTNAQGTMTSGIGLKRKSPLSDASKLRTLGKILRSAKVSFHLKDAFELLAEAKRDDLVYCDPPYDGTLNAYGTGIPVHDEFQADLEKAMSSASAKGAVVYTSNAQTASIDLLYIGRHWPFKYRITVSSRQGRNGHRIEYLFCSSALAKHPVVESPSVPFKMMKGIHVHHSHLQRGINARRIAHMSRLRSAAITA